MCVWLLNGLTDFSIKSEDFSTKQLSPFCIQLYSVKTMEELQKHSCAKKNLCYFFLFLSGT